VTKKFLRGLLLALAPLFLAPSLALAKKDRPVHQGDIANLVPATRLADAAKLIPKAGDVAYLDAKLVHFTQAYISQNFRDNKTVKDLLAALRSGRVKAEDVPPLRIFEHNGALWSLDNRRLYCFKAAGLPVRVVRATPEEVLNESYKYSTTSKGELIEIRGVTNGPVDPVQEALGTPTAPSILREALVRAGHVFNDAFDRAFGDRGDRDVRSSGIASLLDRRMADAEDRDR